MLGFSLARLAALPLALGLALAACSSGGGGAGGGGGQAPARPADPAVKKDLQGRSYDVKMPMGLDPAKEAPLLVMIHGFSTSKTANEDMDMYMRVSPEANKRGVVVALPLGTFDSVISRYEWNATDACCGFDTPDANDIGYIMAMIDDIDQHKQKIDKKRIFVLGHSNGGFMANRLACDQADVFAGIVSLAGATYKDQKKCAASAPIAMLQVHGDADMTVPFGGGHPEGVAQLPLAPGAEETVLDWATKNRCGTTPDTSAAPIDLAADLPGAETSKKVYKGCEGNGATELWIIHGGPHSPDFGPAWAPSVLDFLMAHPKP
jgi:polyhydroxybutyrate depolymerase